MWSLLSLLADSSESFTRREQKLLGRFFRVFQQRTRTGRQETLCHPPKCLKGISQPSSFNQFNLTSLWCLSDGGSYGMNAKHLQMIWVGGWVIWRIGESWGSTQDTIWKIREVAPVEWSITEELLWNSVLPDLSVSIGDGWGWGSRYKLLLAGDTQHDNNILRASPVLERILWIFYWIYARGECYCTLCQNIEKLWFAACWRMKNNG